MLRDSHLPTRATSLDQAGLLQVSMVVLIKLMAGTLPIKAALIEMDRSRVFSIRRTRTEEKTPTAAAAEAPEDLIEIHPRARASLVRLWGEAASVGVLVKEDSTGKARSQPWARVVGLDRASRLSLEDFKVQEVLAAFKELKTICISYKIHGLCR